MLLSQSVIAIGLVGALAFTSAYAQIPDSVKTRIGTLNFDRISDRGDHAQGIR